jgi:hypothetical protein
MTLFRNESLNGRALFFPSATLAREAARNALLQGAPPFLIVAEPVAMPHTKRDLATWLNVLTQGQEKSRAGFAFVPKRQET